MKRPDPLPGETVQEYQDRIGITSRNARMREAGWSGCMHDSDCACSATVIERDKFILNEFFLDAGMENA